MLAGIAMDALPALLQGPLAPHLALQAHCSAVLRYAEARYASRHPSSVDKRDSVSGPE